MTQKALNFIVSGMLNSEREVAEKRIAYILSRIDDNTVIDGFTDGFVTTVTIEDEQKLFSHVCGLNKFKTFTRLKAYTIKQEGFYTFIDVECERIVYSKPGGKTWETNDKKEGEYTERTTVSFTQRIRIYPGCEIPGVSYTIL